MQQVPQTPKSVFPYSVGSSFSTPDQDQQNGKQSLSFWVSILFTRKSHIETSENFFGNMAVKSSIYLKFLPQPVFFRLFILLIVSLIQGRNFQAKQNQFFIKRINFVLKEKKDSRSFFIWTLKKMRNLICIFCNFLVRQLYYHQRAMFQ